MTSNHDDDEETMELLRQVAELTAGYQNAHREREEYLAKLEAARAHAKRLRDALLHIERLAFPGDWSAAEAMLSVRDTASAALSETEEET